jgi:hypothetical protein
MKTAMDGVRAKMTRAEENIRNLDAEIAAVLRTTPPSYTVLGQLQNNGLEYVIVAKGKIVIPLRIPVLIGEIVHHLRSSLDHLITALVIKNGGTPTSHHQFPICTSADEFKKSVDRGRIQDVSPSAAKIIESVQPYTNPTPTDTVLHAVKNLNNLDKHRLLIVTTSVASIGRQMTVGQEGSELLDAEGNKAILTGITLADIQEMSMDGIEIVRLTFAKPLTKFSVKTEVAVQVVFAELGLIKLTPVVHQLFALMDGVNNTIGLFSGEV